MANIIPHLYEIEDMVNFAKKHQHLYLYGCTGNQEALLKFFDICGINVDGFITTWPDSRELHYRVIPKYTLDTVNLENAGIVVGLSDKYYDGVIPRLRERGFTDYFLMSEHNKHAIAYKLTPHPRERMWFEINLVDHCNLNCQMCDHFSHLATPKFLNVDEFRRDMERLAELSGNCMHAVKLQGGEPLMHKDINRFIEITRELFPECEIRIFTNGLMLLKAEHYENGNFWQCCVDNNADILLTKYPINLDLESIKKKASEYGASLEICVDVAELRYHNKDDESDSSKTGNIKKSSKNPFDLKGSVEKHNFIGCYHLNWVATLRHGKLYPCPIRAYAEYFNNAFNKNLKLSEEDCIDIYKAQSYEELYSFVASRIPFCRYCDIRGRRQVEWAQSKRELSEYVDEC